MRTTRPAIAIDPRHFGRGMHRVVEDDARASTAADDLRLFATAFAAGFVFVSVLIA